MPRFFWLRAISIMFFCVPSCKRAGPAVTDDSSLRFAESQEISDGLVAGASEVKAAGRVTLQGMSIVYYGDFNDEQEAGRHNIGSRQLLWEKRTKWSYESLNSTFCQFGLRRVKGEDIQNFTVEAGDTFAVSTVVHDDALKSVSGKNLNCGFRIQLNDKEVEGNRLFIECSSFNDRVCGLSDVTAKATIAEFLSQSVTFRQREK